MTPLTRKRSGWIKIGALLLVAVAGGGWWLLGREDAAAKPAWRLAKVDRGTIASTVTASGTLRALVTVDVGTQVSGQIKQLFGDFNTEVRAGQPIARLDPATFEAKVNEADADLATARANVTMQRARLENARAEWRRAKSALEQAKLDLERKKALLATRAVAQSAYDNAVASVEQAEAAINGLAARESEQKAQIEVAEAQVLQKAAVLQRARIDLDNTVIRSPVDGVIIGRNVDIGQTVAASLQSPVLFVIAQNLRQMQVEVSVDEADIGRIREGQRASFTVDSFPGATFPGAVRQVRKQPREVSNVITYTVVVSAENADLRLLPGMTANVTFDITRRDDVVRVPNAALRFRPPAETSMGSAPGPAPAHVPPAPTERAGGDNPRQRAEEFVRSLVTQLQLDREQEEQVRAIFADLGRRFREMRAGGTPIEQVREEMGKLRAELPDKIRPILTSEQLAKYQALMARSSDAPRQGALFVNGDSAALVRVEVQLGVTDGNFTELVGGPLKPGDLVIVGIDHAKRATPSASRGPRFGF
jgi:HlyD family secretion protein